MRTIYRAASVYTGVGVPDGPAADCLLVDGDRIVWVGRSDDLGPGASDRVVDLGDVLVTPAFVDAHAHLTETGLLLRGVDLSTARSVVEILDRVAAAVRDGQDPVLGHGWDETLLAEGRPPTSVELDRAGRGAAVYLARVDVHSAVISSALAAACGAARHDGWDDTGRVERDAHHAARSATRDGLTDPARRDAQLSALREAARQGIAAVHEMSAPHIAPDEDLRALAALVAAPDPTTGDALPDVVPYRGELVASPQEARAVVERVGVPLAGLAGDLNVDGSVGSRTAAYRDDYDDAPGHRGHLYLSVEQVRDHIAACTAAGLQGGFHAIGDAAVGTALRGVRLAALRVGIAAVRGARHRLEHVESIAVGAVADLADLGLVASVQPAFDNRWGGEAGMYAARLGAARALAMNPLRALAAAGVTLAFGSDTPVTPFDPWGAVRASAAHRVPAQRLDVAAAFACHTVGGWRAARLDGAGRLTVGAPATFAAWRLDGRAVGVGKLPDVGRLPDVGPGRPTPDCTLAVSRGLHLTS